MALSAAILVAQSRGEKLIDLSTLLKYYKQLEVQEAILACSAGREVAVKFGDKGFGKRPDVLNYPKDVLEFAKQGATSFHVSEEHWSNPLQLQPNMQRHQLDSLRTGWDLVLDIDCKHLEYSKIAAKVLVDALRYHGIEALSVKFSGSSGFHIAVPFNAFPEEVNGIATKLLFPEGPRRVASYLKEFVRKVLAIEMLKFHDIAKIAETTGKQVKDLMVDDDLDPYTVLGIDTVLISSRHLYRMPYCFNEKSGLVSVPVTPEKILDFEKDDALPRNVNFELGFLDKMPKAGEARKLLVQAFDFHPVKEEPVKMMREFETPEAVPEQYFPPCIRLIEKGLQDGKKRALFALLNFFESIGWPYDRIEKWIVEWNKKNSPPLREQIIRSQLDYHKKNKKKVLPPNCLNRPYYIEIGVCKPDNFCKLIKNPAQYAIKKQRLSARQKADS